MKITIDQPCHEDWNRMQPSEQGAFCAVCCKTVVDFSSKSLDEIKAYFSNRTGADKLCGRFRHNQLEALSFDDFLQDFMGWAWIKKVALIVFFVFGLSLFGCAQTPERHQDMIAGGISYVPPDTLKKQPDSTQTGHPRKMGKVKVKPAVAQPRPKAKRDEEPRMLGEVVEQRKE